MTRRTSNSSSCWTSGANALDVPAVTLAVDGPGRSRFVAASGTEERDGDTPATAEAQFRVASTTKLFVATVVLQLVEEGRLRLDDPVSTYVPGFRHARGVTIRQLLNHTSGIPDYTRTDHFHEGLLADRDREWSTDELLALVADVRRDFAPGTDYLYSNTGYLLLGRVIDTVTGSTWAAEVRRRILDPLRLQHTYVAGAEPVPAASCPGTSTWTGTAMWRTSRPAIPGRHWKRLKARPVPSSPRRAILLPSPMRCSTAGCSAPGRWSRWSPKVRTTRVMPITASAWRSHVRTTG